MQDQLELALSQLRKLSASKTVLQRESDEAQADVVYQRTRLEKARQEQAAMAGDAPKAERSRVESEVRRAGADLDRAEARVEDKQDRRAFVEEEIVNVERWRHWLNLEIVQLKAANEFKYMEAAALQRSLDVKAQQLQALWSLAPRVQDDLMVALSERSRGIAGVEHEPAAQGVAEGDEGDERIGMDILNEIQELQKEMAPLQAVVCLSLRSDNERLQVR